jgi:hypothetical protein
VRRNAQERASLAARLEHQMQMPMLEIAYAAMNESRRSARCAASEIVTLDERRAKTAQCRIPRNPRAVDATADDQHIERFSGEPLQPSRPMRCRVVGGIELSPNGRQGLVVSHR